MIALLCRTSDRTAEGALGAEIHARLAADRMGAEARMVGSPGTAGARDYAEYPSQVNEIWAS